MKIKSRSIRLSSAGVVLVASLFTHPAPAASLYWSGDGATVGGSGTWDVSSANWAATPAGPFTTIWTNANNDTAVFTNDTGIVALGTGITVGGLRFDAVGLANLGNHVITNDVLTFGTSGSIAVNVATNNQGSTIASIIAGSGTITKTGPGVLVLLATNTFSGSVAVNEGWLALGADTTLTATTDARACLPNVTGITVANGATLGAHGRNVVLNAPVTVASGGTATIAACQALFGTGANTTGRPFFVNGGIQGNGNVVFRGVNPYNWVGTIAVSNCTYTGSTLLTTGNELIGTQGAPVGNTNNQNIVVRLLGNNALPTTTVVTLDGEVGVGGGRACEISLNGWNQTLAGLTNIPRNLRNQRIYNASATASRLTISNAADHAFSGVIGQGAAGNNLSLVKSGSGQFTLARAAGNTYTNGTTINGGTLLVNNTSGSGTGTGAVTIGSGGTLAGTGIITGVVTNNSGGILAPGAGGIGALTLNGDVVLNSDSTNTFEVDGTTPANDGVVLGATVTYGGVLQIVPTGTFTNDQTFTLFSGAGATTAGNFASIVGSPGGGLAFAFTNGVLSVISAGPAYPPAALLTNSFSGGTLSLSWRAGQGWKLQEQTNTLSKGLSTNWVNVTDGSVSSTNIPLDKTKPTVFYRLVYP